LRDLFCSRTPPEQRRSPITKRTSIAVAEVPEIADGDAVLGGEQYTAFVNQVLGTSYDEKTIYGWLAMGRLPFGKLGSRIMGSNTAIRRALAEAAGLTAV
jgi:hypothetical protein